MAEIKLYVEASEINNDCMKINNISLHPGINILSYTTEFPSIFTLDISGKGVSDTIIDDDGNIIKDKFISVSTLVVDNLRVSQHLLSKIFELTTPDNQRIVSHYWGFNGTVKLDMNASDALEWHLKTQSYNYNYVKGLLNDN